MKNFRRISPSCSRPWPFLVSPSLSKPRLGDGTTLRSLSGLIFSCFHFCGRELDRHWPLPARLVICAALFASGFVSLFGGLRLDGEEAGHIFANRGELYTVAVGVRNLPVEARFACFPTYNHPLLLNGRKVVMGYPGHLWSLGFDFARTEAELGVLMQGEGDWKIAAKKLGVRYVFWGQEENSLSDEPMGRGEQSGEFRTMGRHLRRGSHRATGRSLIRARSALAGQLRPPCRRPSLPLRIAANRPPAPTLSRAK